jgi:hypothetical protein
MKNGKIIICAVCFKKFNSSWPNAKFCTPKCRNHNQTAITNKHNNRIIGLTSGTKGAMAELMACVDLMRKGYEVFRALSPSSNCDILAIKDGVVHLYEVRTGVYGSPENGSKLSWPNTKTDGKEVLVVTHKDNVVHYITNKDG